jgi:2-iminobutanoate/2-iminopropanoate deaminase
MIVRMPTHCGDETCPSCVVAGDTVYLAHHAGGFESDDVAVQVRACLEAMRRTLAGVDASLDDLVRVHLYPRDLGDFERARAAVAECFEHGFPARMTTTTEFLDPDCLCMLDGVAYRPSA